MKKASSTITQAQRDTVEQAIAAAESKTSAEVVVVVATRSGRYDRAEDTFGFALGLIAVAVAWIVYQHVTPSTQDWISGHEIFLGLVPILGLFTLWTVIGAALATRFPTFARPFIPGLQYEAEVRRRGFEAFHLFRVGDTKSRNGVLIYVSLFERMAWVVADEAVEAALPPSTWHNATQSVVKSFKQGNPGAGLKEAVDLCGTALAERFPRQPGDTDELGNKVNFLD